MLKTSEEHASAVKSYIFNALRFDQITQNASKKPPVRRLALENFLTQRWKGLSSDLFEHLLVDIEVGVDILHIFAIFERFH